MSILLCQLDNSGAAKGLTLGQGTVPLKCDALLTAVLHKLIGLLEGIHLRVDEVISLYNDAYDNSWHVLVDTHATQILKVKVANPNCTAQPFRNTARKRC